MTLVAINSVAASFVRSLSGEGSRLDRPFLDPEAAAETAPSAANCCDSARLVRYTNRFRVRCTDLLRVRYIDPLRVPCTNLRPGPCIAHLQAPCKDRHLARYTSRPRVRCIDHLRGPCMHRHLDPCKGRHRIPYIAHPPARCTCHEATTYRPLILNGDVKCFKNRRQILRSNATPMLCDSTAMDWPT